MTENVRKVFDILGVEPNERFNVDIVGVGIEEEFYYIDENLIVWFETQENRDRSNYNLCNFLRGNIKIIKLPKKKHVGDKKCYEFSHYGKCALCPIRCLDCRGHNVVDSLYEMLKKVAIDKNKDEGLYNFLKYRLDEEVK